MNRISNIAVALLLFMVGPLWGEEPIDFNRDIRPILSDNCYFCHGPDGENQEAGLRLDSFDEARDVIESGYLMERVMAEDPDEQMPPPSANLSLTTAEKELLQKWIEGGAVYEQHWAFVPLPKSVDVPTSTDDQWSKETLDQFVRKKLSDHGIEPSAEAAPRRWLRRVTLDLTGLPPTLQEIDRFLASLSGNAPREAAYREVVDRLLASPAYGEHMAVAWLDAARYADSYGYQSDRLNTQWPYRDWVVKAFNDNLPYDEFVTWQLAGDMLASPTDEQRLATSYNRIHRLNNEGGAVFEEWRLENVADRLQTYGTSMLGLTLECCRCHDHKYDPIPMRDYYSMSAFFNSIDENGVYDNSGKVPQPSLLLPDEEQQSQLVEAQKDLRQAEIAYARVCRKAAKRFENWGPDQDTLKTIPDSIRQLSFDSEFNKKRHAKKVYYTATGDNRPASPLETTKVSNIPFPQMAPEVASDTQALDEGQQSTSRRVVNLDGERGIAMPDMDRFDRWTPFSLVLTLKENERSKERSIIAQSSYGQLTFNGWDLVAIDGYLEFRMYRVIPGNMIAVRTKDKIPLEKWFQVAATYDGSSTANGLKVFVDGQPMSTEVIRDRVKKRASVKGQHGGELTIGQRFRGRGIADWQLDDVRVIGRALSTAEIQHFVTGDSIDPDAEYYVSAIDAEARKSLAKLTAARKHLVMTEESIHEIPIMEESAQPRETHVLARGEYNAPTNEETLVSRRTFAEIGPEFPADAPLDRLGLAQWTTHPDHPLTSRVIVNRLWGNFFGTGLVRTPENFGLQGELPTHPKLLDWLARDFIENGWDIKRFCRKVALSATYRQDSSVSKATLAADPENRLLGRGPAYRLAAEQIRDLALTVSGLMNFKRGGAPVSPYQAGGDLWRESNSMSPSYQQSVGTDLYRRSLYSVWKRTAPLPNMVAFDAQSREVCIVNRARTNTPLQALVLMNDVQFVEACRALAEQSIEQYDDPRDRIHWAFQRMTGREPEEKEAKILIELYEAERQYYQSQPEAAKAFLQTGESKPRSLDQFIETASFTVVCQMIMNLDATIWKR